MDNYFIDLQKIDVTDHIEKKNGLSYVSWAWAWAYVKKMYPDANYTIEKFNGVPYAQTDLGLMVYTTVTINGITHEMWLPVMDSANNAMKTEAYEKKTKYKSFTVEAATMFDVNKTIMRCLTKNIAMHGIGLSLYAGEDLPLDLTEAKSDDISKQDEKDATAYANKASKRNEIIMTIATNHGKTAQEIAEIINPAKEKLGITNRVTEMTDAEFSQILHAIDEGLKTA